MANFSSFLRLLLLSHRSRMSLVIHGFFMSWRRGWLERVLPCNSKVVVQLPTSQTHDVRNPPTTSLVQSRLDYANSILQGVSQINLNKLQRIQNILTKFVLVNHSSKSSTDLLHTLHWLPVKHCINFKIASLTHNLLNTRQKSYLSCFLKAYRTMRDLRSSALSNLHQPASRTNFGMRTFSVAALHEFGTIFHLMTNYCYFSPSSQTFYFSHAR